MKNYENINTEETKNRDFLLSLSFIGEYSTEKNNGKLNIRKITITNYVNDLLKTNSVTPLDYSTLFRFMMFAWFYKYSGTNETLLKLKAELDKGYNQSNDMIRPLNQMPRNRKIISLISNIVKTKNPLTIDYDILVNLYNNKDIIFTENNLVKWYNMINQMTKIANKSENDMINLINTNSDIKLKDAKEPTKNQDLSGIDIIASTNNGQEKTIQVKRVGSESKLEHYWKQPKKYVDSFGEEKLGKKQYLINIKNTNLDLNTFV